MADEVTVCNQALSYLGEPDIRSLDELNKRAGLCKNFYPLVRDSVMSDYDWSFARATKKLQRLAEDSVEGPTYQLPTDCLVPRGILPRGQVRTYWKVMGDTLIVPEYDSASITFDIYLQYTKRETNVSLFSSAFVDVVSLDMAVRMCIPLTADKTLAAELKKELRILKQENEAEDANRGDDSLLPDNDPNNDTFVNPLGLGSTRLLRDENGNIIYPYLPYS